MCKGLIIPVLFGIIIRLTVPTESLLKMLTTIGVYACVFIASMWFFGINTAEKSLLMSPIQTVKGKTWKKVH